MSIESFKYFEKHAIEVGIEKKSIEKIYSDVIRAAISRVKSLPDFYDRLKEDAIKAGIENRMNEKVAEAMAKSFLNLKSIKTIAEGWISERDIQPLKDKLSRLAKLYAEFYAKGPNDASSEDEFSKFLDKKIAENDEKIAEKDEKIAENDKQIAENDKLKAQLAKQMS